MSDHLTETFAAMPVAELVDDLRDVHLSPSQPMRDRAADLLGELEAIVRDLAADNPFQPQPWDSDGCRYCPTPRGGLHYEDCVWNQARVWVSAHPVSGTEGT